MIATLIECNKFEKLTLEVIKSSFKLKTFEDNNENFFGFISFLYVGSTFGTVKGQPYKLINNESY